MVLYHVEFHVEEEKEEKNIGFTPSQIIKYNG